jgi:3-deoxy-manno-octulosonate cytidylyltransferase (CMP-KDO synthetase)
MTEGDRKKAAVIIPVRMASSRFPGKPLAKILGLEMIEHVRRRAQLCKDLSSVLIATCDEEIRRVVEGYGGKVIMTSDSHERCTDRVAEAARKVEADIIINIQGDEPMITPEMISGVLKPLLDDSDCQVVNLISPIDSKEDFINPNVIKTVCGIDGNVLYFSREPIPSEKKSKGPVKAFRQLGVIAFRKDFLIAFSKLPQTPLEKFESIDMLRLLEHGYKIKAAVTAQKSYGVDTPENLRSVEALLKADKLLNKYMV